MAGRFDYVKYDETAAELQKVFKSTFENLEKMIDLAPDSRAKSLALTSLEESYMWVGKMIRDEQLQRNGYVELQEGRKNG